MFIVFLFTEKANYIFTNDCRNTIRKPHENFHRRNEGVYKVAFLNFLFVKRLQNNFLHFAGIEFQLFHKPELHFCPVEVVLRI